jgi:hypothetical protein
MANCRACDAPLKIGANYCVVCGAAQHRSRRLRNKVRAPLMVAALACAAIAAAFSLSLRKPAEHEAHSPAVAASEPSSVAAPEAYLTQPTQEREQRAAVAPVEESNTRVFAPGAPPSDTATSATVRSEQREAKLNESMRKGAVTAAEPPAGEAGSNVLPSFPSAGNDSGASAAPAASSVANPTLPAPVPIQQSDTAAAEPVPAAPETPLPRFEPAENAQQGRTSSQAQATLQGARTVDEIFQQRTARCGGGVIGLLCRGTMRFNVCNGRWTEDLVPGMTVCYVGAQ